MAEMVKCGECGKEVKARGLGVHKRKAHGISGPRTSRDAMDKRRPKKPKHGGRRGARKSPAEPPVRAGTIGNGCLFCGGKDQALAKDLVARLIRGGMGFDVAAELARDLVGMTGTRTERR